VAKVLFDLEADWDEPRARQVYDAHLERARWMTQGGYCEFLGSRAH
jgi:hypothetical protein